MEDELYRQFIYRPWTEKPDLYPTNLTYSTPSPTSRGLSQLTKAVMEDNGIDDKQTAIHEAGHAVAHCRLGIFQACVSIDSEGTYDEDGNLKSSTLGRAVGEGWEHVCDQVQAGDQVLAYYAGYAALLAVGYGIEQASVGAEDDFFLASHLLEGWEIGEEGEWKRKAELLMRDKANVAAVARVAEELLLERHLVMDQVKMLIDVADGAIPEKEYQRVKQAFWKSQRQ